MAAKAQLESANLDPIDGGSVTFYVDGLSGTNPEVMVAACAAGGVPQRNEQYGPGLIVRGGPRVVKMAGNFAAFVQVDIGPAEIIDPGGGYVGTFSLSTRVVSEVTNMDAGGQTITMRNDPANAGMAAPGNRTITLPDGSNTLSERKKQTGEVQKYVPVTVLRVSRKEPKLPIYLAYRNVGRTNAAAFCGFPPEYWLCAGVDADTSDRNKSFDCTYEFWGNEYGWLQAALYRLDTGEFKEVTPQRILTVNPPRLRFDENAAIRNGGGVFKSTPNQVQFNGMTLVRVQGVGDFSKFENIVLPTNIDTDFAPPAQP